MNVTMGWGRLMNMNTCTSVCACQKKNCRGEGVPNKIFSNQKNC